MSINTRTFPCFGVCPEHEKEICQGPALLGVRQRDDQARQERFGLPAMAVRPTHPDLDIVTNGQGETLPASEVPRLAARGRAPNANARNFHNRETTCVWAIWVPHCGH